MFKAVRLVALVAAATIFLSYSAVCANAEVVRIEVRSRNEFLGGKSFGSVGAYEQLEGKIFFAVDPKNPLNTVIADMDKAPRNQQGQVEFSSDFSMLKPKVESRGN